MLRRTSVIALVLFLSFLRPALAVTVGLGDPITFNACAQDIGGTIRLTNPGGSVPVTCTYDINGNRKGTAFLSTPLQNLPGTSFEAFFAYRIQGGGDGLALVLHNDPRGATAAGGGGEGQGWGSEWMGNPAIVPSWRVVVDTFKNSWNPSDNYIGFHKNYTVADANVGPLESVYGTPSYDLNNANTQYIWVDYDAITYILTVYASQSDAKPLAPLFSVTNQELSELGQQFYVGFTAGIGGSVGIHDIEQFSMTTTVVPVPGAVWLFGSGLLGLAGFVRRRA